MIDPKTISRGVTMLASALGVEVTELLLEAYAIALHDLEPEAFQSAIAAALRSCKFMPRPAELRDLAGAPEGAKAVEGAAVLAWETLRRAIGQHGRYRSVDFEDAAINASVRSLGGWDRVCGLEGDEFETWARKEFLRCYSLYTTQGAPAELAGRLVGLVEKGEGWSGAEPVRVLSLGAVPRRRALGPLEGENKVTDTRATDVLAAPAVRRLGAGRVA